MGLSDYPSSRAIYAIDLMLKWDSHPDGKGTFKTRTFHPVLPGLDQQHPGQPWLHCF